MANYLASSSTNWTVGRLTIAAIVLAGATLLVASAPVLRRTSPDRVKGVSSPTDSSWQVTALVLFGLTVVLAVLTILAGTQTNNTTRFGSTVIFTDLAGIGTLLSGIAASLVLFASYRDRRKRSEQQADAAQKQADAAQRIFSHAIRKIDRPLEIEDIRALTDLARDLNGGVNGRMLKIETTQGDDNTDARNR